MADGPNLPAIADARLPATYEAAQKALADCSRVDECKDWADKAAALASYARQAKDSTLHTLALRIQARAIRRAGELLKQIPDQNRGRPTKEIRDGTVPNITRQSAAAEAGLSERQRKTAMRVASVPQAEFEAAVESDAPPNITELAARGTATRPPAPPTAAAPADSATANRAQALVRDFAAFCAVHEPAGIARSAAIDADVMRGCVATIDRWIDRFVMNLGAGKTGS